MEFFIYLLNQEWNEDRYRKLIDVAFEKNSHFMFSVQNPLHREGQLFINQLKPFLVNVYESNRWPGTVLFGDKRALIYKCRLTSVTCNMLKKSFSHLWDWKAPTYPEDLSFLRKNGVPWFISITHEKEVFFKLEAGETKEIEKFLGTNSLKLDTKDLCPDEKY